MQVTNTKSNFSKVMQSIKWNFTLNYKKKLMRFQHPWGCGNHVFGITLFATIPIYQTILTIYIGIRSNMSWLRTPLIGHIHHFRFGMIGVIFQKHGRLKKNRRIFKEWIWNKIRRIRISGLQTLADRDVRPTKIVGRLPFLLIHSMSPIHSWGESEAFAKQAYCACRMPKYARYPLYKYLLRIQILLWPQTY